MSSSKNNEKLHGAYTFQSERTKTLGMLLPTTEKHISNNDTAERISLKLFQALFSRSV
jgi:hypothetical protein